MSVKCRVKLSIEAPTPREPLLVFRVTKHEFVPTPQLGFHTLVSLQLKCVAIWTTVCGSLGRKTGNGAGNQHFSFGAES